MPLMSYGPTYYTKILTLAIAPFLSTSIGVLCEFARVLHVYILMSPQEVHSLPEGTNVHIWQHIHQKVLHLCLPKYYNT